MLVVCLLQLIMMVILPPSPNRDHSLPPSLDDDGSSTDHDGSPSPSPDPPNNLLCCALCIVFDSESVGFAGALARVFERVCIIRKENNFALSTFSSAVLLALLKYIPFLFFRRRMHNVTLSK